MKRIIGLLLLSCQSVFGQQPFVAQIRNEDTHQLIPGASVIFTSVNKAGISDNNGIVIIGNLTKAQYDCRVSCTGFKSRDLKVYFPFKGIEDTLRIFLEPAVETLQNIVVSSTRLNQLVKNSPVHIDVIGKEDIEEGTAMSPGNIRELLTELSGTQVQQTSAVSGNLSIRLQGLDGRYTQLLKDGFPLYGGFSGSLNILQTPPLDLKQVEIIKGAGSALYGGDAIAGIINLISVTPDSVIHARAIINQTFKGGTDWSGFYSERKNKLGFTLLATASRQQPYDVNKDGFTDLPKVWQLTVAPVLFWYPDDSTTLRLGINISTENRAGGDIKAIKHGSDSVHSFLEKNHTDRDYYQLSLTRRMGHSTFSIKNTLGYFYRSIYGIALAFTGRQVSSFTEASLAFSNISHQDIVGADFITDKFSPRADSASPPSLYYANNTIGFFAQDDWQLNKRVTLETGLRTDVRRQIYLLPRVALMYKMTSQLTARLGAGLGYKLPSVFNAGSEEDAYRKVYPISSAVQAERSSSANLAFNYHGHIGDEINFQLDQDFYYTRLSHALIPETDSLLNGWLYYISAPDPIISKGFETNAKFFLEDWSLNVSYTYTDAKRTYQLGAPQLPLTPRSRFVTSFLYEIKDKFRTGIETFYTGHQYLDDGNKTPDFLTFDVMVEKRFGHFSVLANLENFTDQRQSRFGSLYSGTEQHPVFGEIYAPLEGIVGNIALCLKW